MDGGCPAPDSREREQSRIPPVTPARQLGKTNQVESIWPNFGQLEQVASNLESKILVVLNRCLPFGKGPERVVVYTYREGYNGSHHEVQSKEKWLRRGGSKVESK